MGTNCLGPYLLTKLLLPVLQSTAESSPPGMVRVTWASSLASEVLAPKGGIRFDTSGTPKVLGKNGDYAQSKVGNIFLAHEFAKRHGKEGIISVVGKARIEWAGLLTSLGVEPGKSGYGLGSTSVPSAELHYCEDFYLLST
jgi:NAD(P)-dependent dehydrogenase (short-subunit alcohol dehydrogenase family)